jgi:hypothetical protein
MCCELLNRYRDNYKTQSIVETEVKIVETEVKSIYLTHIYITTQFRGLVQTLQQKVA